MNVDDQTHTLLRAYQRRHLHGVSFSDFLMRMIATAWTRLAIIGVIGGFVSYRVPALGWLAVGIVIGVIARDIGYFRALRRIWSTLDAITDWPKVDELAGPYPASES